jgi:hypothetical protein
VPEVSVLLDVLVLEVVATFVLEVVVLPACLEAMGVDLLPHPLSALASTMSEQPRSNGLSVTARIPEA